VVAGFNKMYLFVFAHETKGLNHFFENNLALLFIKRYALDHLLFDLVSNN
jgi:hypothetical protein